MAKDDYNRIVCTMLAYLYARLRGKSEEKPESFLQPMTKDFPISEEYFFFILDEMLQKGYIKGIKIIRAWGGDIVRVSGMSRINITGDGIQYLCENSTMRKTMEWIRDNTRSIPGIVSTVVDISQI